MAVDAGLYFGLQPLQSMRLTLAGAMVPAAWWPSPVPARAAGAWPVIPRLAATPRAASGTVSFHAQPRAVVKRSRTSSPPRIRPAAFDASRAWGQGHAPRNYAKYPRRRFSNPVSGYCYDPKRRALG